MSVGLYFENWAICGCDTYAGFPAAIAAALSAFVVPGRLEAELSAPNRLEGLGATTLALGRGAVVFAGLPFWAPSTGRLPAPLAGTAGGLLGSLGFDVTTIRFVAGWALLSPSLGRFEPEISEGESAEEPFPEESSAAVSAIFCFHLVAAAALSRIFWAGSLIDGPPFLIKRGSSLARFVFCKISSSTVMNCAKSWIFVRRVI